MTNVEALTEIALGFLPPGDEYDRRNRAHAIALHLARSGCLQVDSLTDEQMMGLASDVTWEMVDPEFPEELAQARAALRRCATGQAE